jgi:histone H3/H4
MPAKQKCSPAEGETEKTPKKTSGVHHMRGSRVRKTARDIKHAQQKNKNAFPNAPLVRIARELLRSMDPNHRITVRALEILRYADDIYAMDLCRKVGELAKHGKRTTIMGKDFAVWQRICSEATIPMPDLGKLIESAATPKTKK